MTLKYCKSEKINIRDYYDEKWLQSLIEEDPGLLGLGDVILDKGDGSIYSLYSGTDASRHTRKRS